MMRSLIAMILFVSGASAFAEESVKVEVQPDGTKIIKKGDGTSIEIKPDGSKFVQDADGSSVLIRPDGTKLIKKADGTVIDVKAH